MKTWLSPRPVLKTNIEKDGIEYAVHCGLNVQLRNSPKVQERRTPFAKLDSLNEPHFVPLVSVIPFPTPWRALQRPDARKREVGEDRPVAELARIATDADPGGV